MTIWTVRDLLLALMIWLIKIPLVILVGAWAIWLYSTPSDQVILTIKRAWKRIRGARN